MTLSVLQSVYKNDNPVFLESAFESIFNQKLKPKNIVLVKDGLLTPELELVISKWKSLLPMNVVGYEKNQGLAHALNYGLDFVDSDLVARMDSDDVCCSDRFEKQVNYFIDNPETKILGSSLTEFYENNNGEIYKRVRNYPEVVNKSSRCLFKGTPLGHPSLVIKTEVLREFRYNENTSMNEDIDLWFRLIKNGYIICNIKEPLINFRITDGTFKRRHFAKAINEYKIYRSNLYELFGFSFRQFYPLLRLCTRVLPSKLVKMLYFSDFRKKILEKKV